METTIRAALARDLARAQMTQETFGKELGLTQQAIDKWCDRNSVPRRHWKRIGELLGAESELLRIAPFAVPTSLSDSDTEMLARLSEHVDKAEKELARKREEYGPDLSRRNLLIFNAPSHGKPSESERDTLLKVLQQTVPNVDTSARLMVGGWARRFDAVTPHLVANIVGLRAMPGSGERPILSTAPLNMNLLNLALLKRTQPDARCYLIGVVEGFQPEAPIPLSLARAKWDAEQFGVVFKLFGTYEEAANYLSDAEHEHELEDMNPEDLEEFYGADADMD